MYGYLGTLLGGYNFIESRHMTIVGKTRVYKLTRKWKPRRIRRVTEIKPNPEVIIMGNTIIGHPQTIASLKVKMMAYRTR